MASPFISQQAARARQEADCELMRAADEGGINFKQLVMREALRRGQWPSEMEVNMHPDAVKLRHDLDRSLVERAIHHNGGALVGRVPLHDFDPGNPRIVGGLTAHMGDHWVPLFSDAWFERD